MGPRTSQDDLFHGKWIRKEDSGESNVNASYFPITEDALNLERQCWG